MTFTIGYNPVFASGLTYSQNESPLFIGALRCADIHFVENYRDMGLAFAADRTIDEQGVGCFVYGGNVFSSNIK